MAITAAFQGIEGAHSSVTLAAYFRGLGAEHVALGVPTYRQVATTVITGRADVGILPVDNAIAGTVRDGYDLLAQYDLLTLSEVEWRMDHRLLGIDGATLSEVREVHAHPLVLAECGRFLGTLAGARITPSIDTGVACREVTEGRDKSRAAIGPPEAATVHGLVELARNVADHPENYTRFIVFASRDARDEVRALGERTPPEKRKTSLLFATKHERGALAACLRVLSDANINLAKLESRPKLGKKWEHLFYVDFDGDAEQDHVKQALEQLATHTTSVQVIGTYDVGSAHADTTETNPTRAIVARGTASEERPPLPSNAAANYPKAARKSDSGTRLSIGGTVLGGDEFVVIAGPCSVETRDQVMATAKCVVAGGAKLLRGGAFKPRTNPYAFQGLGWDGVSLLAEAGRATGVPIVSEVMSVDQVERMAREVDVLQIGARNMQNFDLLRAVGRTERPILLKRGMSASLDELLAAAEYVLAEGNPHVVLCERGIRTFETATRNTLDLSAVPVLRERTHLPVFVDPSHGVGVRRFIRPLCLAAKAVGAHGIIIEVHPNPAEAKSDKDQALTFDDFAEIMEDLESIPYEGRP